MANRWVAGARPRTLPAAIVPVVVGTGVAASEGSVVWWRVAAALVVSLAIQVGTNYANDYSDGIRGTDDARVGPLRLVAAGLASPRAVKLAALGAFAVAGVAGLALAIVVSPWLILVGAACLAAGWFYTGGPRPYGYAGFGEVFVFVFFGLVAVVGTAFVSLERITLLAVLCAVPVGLLATAMLVVNNLRDRATDAVSGKRTLAVRLGDERTRGMYKLCIGLPFAVVLPVAQGHPVAFVVLLAGPLSFRLVRRVDRATTAPDLIAVLGETGRLQLAFGGLLALGLALS